MFFQILAVTLFFEFLALAKQFHLLGTVEAVETDQIVYRGYAYDHDRDQRFQSEKRTLEPFMIRITTKDTAMIRRTILPRLRLTT